MLHNTAATFPSSLAAKINQSHSSRVSHYNVDVNSSSLLLNAWWSDLLIPTLTTITTITRTTSTRAEGFENQDHRRSTKAANFKTPATLGFSQGWPQVLTPCLRNLAAQVDAETRTPSRTLRRRTIARRNPLNSAAASNSSTPLHLSYQ